MPICKSTAFLAVLLAPAALAAPPPSDEDVDEVVVIGQTVPTSIATVEVDREIMVDTAVALKDIPGANVNANGPVTGIAQYRGMHGDRVSVVIDQLGVVSGGPNAMDAPLSYASPMITRELAVTRGIASVSLAPESIGGHVATTLSRGDFSTGPGALSGFVGTRYSGNGAVSTSAGRLTFASDRHKVSLLAELDEGGDIDTPAGTIRPSRLHRERSDMSYAFSGEHAAILLFAGRLDTSDTGTPALPMDIRYIETDLAGAHVEVEAADRVTLRGRFAWNDVAHLMDNFSLRQAPMAPMYRQNLATGSGVHLNLEAGLALPSGGLTIGFDALTSDHDATITNPNNAMFRVSNFAAVERDLASLFAEWRRAGERADLELGLRVKRVDAAAGEVGADGMMGGMGTNVDLLADAFNAANRDLRFDSVDAVLKYRRSSDSDTEWHVEVGSKTRAPSYQELYLWLPLQATGGLADGRSYIGDPGLKEERSNEITLGYGKTAGRFSVSPQLFYRRVDGYIQGAPSSNMIANMVAQMMTGAPALQFANVDAEIWGADVAWRFELTDRWYLDGIATYARGKRRDVNDNLYRLAPPNAKIGVTREHDGLAKTAELGGHARQDKGSAFNEEQETPGYALTNLGLAWSPTESLRLEARVENLFDTSYQDHVAGINRANGSDIPVGTRLYGAERTLTAGAVWQF